MTQNTHDLQEAFLAQWQQLTPDIRGGKILAAVSGGRDSMALVHLLLTSGIPFAIAHCNFQLRGADSNADAELVKSFAAAHQINCHCIAFDSLLHKAASGKSIQEEARTLRYDWFSELQQTFGYAFIATAHHADDNAETLLMNLARGTGLSGLHGIPVINGSVIRPLLFATRAAIDAYIAQHGIPFREDVSNASDKYSRNAIRHHVLPALTAIYPQSVQGISQSIRRFTGAEKYYRKSVDKELKKLLEQRGKDYYIPLRLLAKSLDLHTIVYELFTPFGFSSGQMPEILRLMKASSGHFIESETHRIIRDRDFFILTAQDITAADFLLIETGVATVMLPEGTLELSEATAAEISTENPACIFVDAEKLEWPLMLRRRKTGDYFYPAGFDMKKKKLSRFLIDKKIPVHEKERIWLLTSGKSVVWILGMRSDERFKIGKNAKKILRIEFKSR